VGRLPSFEKQLHAKASRSLTFHHSASTFIVLLPTNNDSGPIASIDLVQPLIYNISVPNPSLSATEAAARTLASRHPISTYLRKPFQRQTELLKTYNIQSTYHYRRVLEICSDL